MKGKTIDSGGTRASLSLGTVINNRVTTDWALLILINLNCEGKHSDDIWDPFSSNMSWDYSEISKTVSGYKFGINVPYAKFKIISIWRLTI